MPVLFPEGPLPADVFPAEPPDGGDRDQDVGEGGVAPEQDPQPVIQGPEVLAPAVTQEKIDIPEALVDERNQDVVDDERHDRGRDVDRPGQAAARKGRQDGRGDQHAQAFARPPSQALGDDGVGAEGQVVAVLLDPADGQDDRTLLREISPDRLDGHELHHREGRPLIDIHLRPPQAPAAASRITRRKFPPQNLRIVSSENPRSSMSWVRSGISA